MLPVPRRTAPGRAAPAGVAGASTMPARGRAVWPPRVPRPRSASRGRTGRVPSGHRRHAAPAGACSTEFVNSASFPSEVVDNSSVPPSARYRQGHWSRLHEIPARDDSRPGSVQRRERRRCSTCVHRSRTVAYPRKRGAYRTHPIRNNEKGPLTCTGLVRGPLRSPGWTRTSNRPIVRSWPSGLR